jgi:nicotinamide-nucleotide amidase
MEHTLFNLEQINQIKSKLAERSETIAVAESVTAGLLQLALSSAEDARDYFQGGITVYNLGQKARHLLVEPIHAEASNCVSEKVARQMSMEVTRLFQSNWGVAITGYASPAPESGNRMFAYYSFVNNGVVVHSGLIEPVSSGFPDVQLEYVNKLVRELCTRVS